MINKVCFNFKRFNNSPLGIWAKGEVSRVDGPAVLILAASFLELIHKPSFNLTNEICFLLPSILPSVIFITSVMLFERLS